MSSPARDDEPTSSNAVDLPDFAEDLSMDSYNVSSSQADSTSAQAAPQSPMELPTGQEPDSTEALDMTTKSEEPESSNDAADAVSTSNNVAVVKPDNNTSNEAEAEQKVEEEVEAAEKEVEQDDVTGSSDNVPVEREGKEEAELADTTNQEAADTGSEKTESVEDEKEKEAEAASESDTSEKMEVDEVEKSVEKAAEKADEKVEEEKTDEKAAEDAAEKSDKKSGKKADKKVTDEKSEEKETESTSKDSGKRKVKAEVQEQADGAPAAKQPKVEQEEEEQELMLQKEKPIKAEVTDPAAIALQKDVQAAIKLYQKYQDEKQLVQRLAVPDISPYVMAVGTKQLTENFNRVTAFQKRADEASTVEEFKPLLDDLESNIRRARQSQEINNLLGHLF